MRASRFLATTLCRWAAQSVSVGGAPIGRSAQESAHNQRCEAPLALACGRIGDRELDDVWQECIGVEENGQFFSVRVGVELGRDVRDMVLSLLAKHRVEGAAHGCDQLCGSATERRQRSTALSDNLYCAWRRSLLASDKRAVEVGIVFPKRGERQHPRKRRKEGFVPL